MGIFRRADPDDTLIKEFWSWFVGFENTLTDVVKGMNEKTTDDKKAYDAVMTLSGRMQKICYDTKKLVAFKFGGDLNARLELVFFPANRYILKNIKRMAELMPLEIEERWDIITDEPEDLSNVRTITK